MLRLREGLFVKNRQIKRLLVIVSMLSLVFILTACGTAPVSEHSTGFWDRYVVYTAGQFVIWLANLFGGNPGVGIIAFTLIIRILIFPLSYLSIKSMAKQQELAPQMKELQQKYSSKDTETQTKLRDETQKLYASAGVNPVMGCLPIVIQMPFLIALYQAILRTTSLQSGTFLWMNLSKPDPWWVMQILATLFTLGTSILSMMAQPTRNSSSWIMMIISPLMIFVFSVTLPSALAIYWVVTNAFSMVQQLLIQNPFKIRREREEKARAEKEKERALRKAYKKATKRRK